MWTPGPLLSLQRHGGPAASCRVPPPSTTKSTIIQQSPSVAASFGHVRDLHTAVPHWLDNLNPNRTTNQFSRVPVMYPPQSSPPPPSRLDSASLFHPERQPTLSIHPSIHPSQQTLFVRTSCDARQGATWIAGTSCVPVRDYVSTCSLSRKV